MHELPIAESIRDIALHHAARVQAQRITQIHLVMGQLSSLVDNSLQFYWDLISQGTLAEGARLNFQRVPATLVCLDCGQAYGIPAGLTACPTCEGLRVRVIAGDECRVDSLEVEGAPVALEGAG